jgi:hypothetical protein
MMCYRDRTFCKQDDCKKRETCIDYFSEYHKKKAKEWWGKGGGKRGEAPVCFLVNAPECYEKES